MRMINTKIRIVAISCRGREHRRCDPGGVHSSLPLYWQCFISQGGSWVTQVFTILLLTPFWVSLSNKWLQRKWGITKSPFGCEGE